MQILLVEDDRDLRRFLSKAFREEGYGVTETDSGDRALERAVWQLQLDVDAVALDDLVPALDAAVAVGDVVVTQPLVE